MAAPLSQPVSLREARIKSTLEWKANLKSLFEHAKDWFPDVVWELTGEGIYKDKVVVEIWGHRAMIYARAPPSFRSRYFSFKPSPLSLSYPYHPSPPGLSEESAPSLTNEDQPIASPVLSSIQPGISHIRTPINSESTLFPNKLEYFYTGQDFKAFGFLNESFIPPLYKSRPESDTEEARIDKLREDLFFLWRARLYSDVCVSLTGNFSSSPHEDTKAVFSSHRFILVSRCPYFFNALLSCSKPKSQQNDEDGTLTLSLPSPPFTPASLHFTLGFIYTGTLIFPNEKYDLDTAFAILRSATYLSLNTLHDEIQAYIIQEMMHGLFHAFLSFPEYENLIGEKWGTGGCRCNRCARRVPRVLKFAIANKNLYLERGAQRALVNLFGEGWCTLEFASLPKKSRVHLLKGVRKQTIPENVFPLLFAAERALVKLNPITDSWGDTVRKMIESGRHDVDDMLCNQPVACFSQSQWLEIMKSDGAHFEGGEQVEWIMKSLLRGVDDKNAPMLYQTLAPSVLLPSYIRVQVEQAQSDILARICRRWPNICQEGGFDDLEGWTIKRITDAIAGAVRVPRYSALRVRNTTGDSVNDTGVRTLNRSLRRSNHNNFPTHEGVGDVVSLSPSMFTARSKFSTATNISQTTTAGSIKNSLDTASSGAFITANDNSSEINSKESFRIRQSPSMVQNSRELKLDRRPIPTKA